MLIEKNFWRGCLVVGLLAMLLVWPGFVEPILHNDSSGYLFFGTQRQPGYVLFTSLLGVSPFLVVFQVVASLAAWCWLGSVIGGRVGAVLLTVFAMTGAIYQWNLMVLTESLSLTLLAALLAMTCMLCGQWRLRWWGLWCLCALLFAAIRPTNALVPLPLALVFLVGERGLRRSGGLALIGVLLLGGVAVHQHIFVGAFKEMMLSNVITARVLPDAEARTWFERHGMPGDDALQAYSGRIWVFHGDLELASPDYAAWLRTEGSSTYTRYLLTHSKPHVDALSELLPSARNSMLPDYLKDRRLPSVSRRLEPFYRYSAPSFWLWCVLVLGPLLLAFRERRVTPLLFLPTVVGVACLGQSLVAYLGDAGEVSRHSLVASTLYRVAAAMGLFAMIRFIGWRGSRGNSGAKLAAPEPRS